MKDLCCLGMLIYQPSLLAYQSWKKITLKTNLLNIDFSTIANSLMRKLNEKL
jgi:hypothetical protein